jgi:hypothetical protein
MGDKLWKAVERSVARRLGGVRTGPTGCTGPDVVTDWCSVEVKTRRRLPTWLKEAVHQASAGAGGDRLPLVVLHQAGQRHDGDLVIMRLRDLERLLGNASDAPSDEHSLTLNSGSDHDGR